VKHGVEQVFVWHIVDGRGEATLWFGSPPLPPSEGKGFLSQKKK